MTASDPSLDLLLLLLPLLWDARFVLEVLQDKKKREGGRGLGGVNSLGRGGPAPFSPETPGLCLRFCL